MYLFCPPIFSANAVDPVTNSQPKVVQPLESANKVNAKKFSQESVTKSKVKKSPQEKPVAPVSQQDKPLPNPVNKAGANVKNNDSAKFSGPKGAGSSQGENSSYGGSDKKANPQGGSSSKKEEKISSAFRKIENKKDPGIANNISASRSNKSNSVSNFSQVNRAKKSKVAEAEDASYDVQSTAPESWTVESESTESPSEENFATMKQPSNDNTKALNDAKWLFYSGVGLVAFSFLGTAFFVISFLKRRGRLSRKSRINREESDG